MSSSRVTVVIVTYCSEDTILEALEPVKRGYDNGLLECVVVDNHSPDSTVELVSQHHSWLTLIESRENLGYGRGCNLGFKHVQTPYMLLLNPDAIIEPEDLKRLLDFMDERSKAGIVAPAIQDQNNLLQNAGGLPTPSGILKNAAWAWQPEMRRPIQQEETFQTDWLCGAIMLIRCELFQRIGGFDPRFFLYFEETDLCLRSRQAGAELWAFGKVIAHHACHASVQKQETARVTDGVIGDHFYRSRFYYLAKHYGYPAAVLADLGELILYGIKDVARLLTLRRRESKFIRRLHLPLLSTPAIQ